MYMEHYDENREPSPSRQKPRRRGGWFLSSLIGAIIGGIVVVTALPFLSNLNLLPNPPAEENQGSIQNGEDIVQKTVSVDVNTDITKAVNQVNEAVVGVVNIQQGESFGTKAGKTLAPVLVSSIKSREIKPLSLPIIM